MATKKQKRAAALSKRAEFLERNRLAGLAAQEKDREARARRDKAADDELTESNRQLTRDIARVLVANMFLK